LLWYVYNIDIQSYLHQYYELLSPQIDISDS